MGKESRKNVKRNEKFISEFENWLNEKGLVKKTTRKHVNNASLYINDYLNYYDVSKMEEGVHYVHGFLDGWFIEKCLWSSKNSIKETAASIKKFYECMSEKEYLKHMQREGKCAVIYIGFFTNHLSQDPAVTRCLRDFPLRKKKCLTWRGL